MANTSSSKGGGGSKTVALKNPKGSKKLIVRRRKVITARKILSGKKGNLPSFQLRSQPNAVKTNENRSILTEEDGDGFGELPCDTLLAIQSLQTNSQGLHIPLDGNQQIQILLETQIFQRFEEDHASTIMSELESLIQSNQLRRLSCQDEGETALVFTNDYIGGVWDAHRQHSTAIGKTCAVVEPQVIAWFVDCLKDWTELAISEEAMQDSWEADIIVCKSMDDTQSIISFNDALRALLELQVLLREPTSSTTTTQQYHLWLPQWGLVLKRWNEARQQLVTFVARSKGGEISERNVLNKNRHSSVSTKFLLDELAYRGKLRIIQRPFGRFIQRVVDK
jgi:hypothetical protein